MHKTTKEELDKVARWTRDIIAADDIVAELEPSMVAQTDDCDTWSALANNFGNLDVYVYDALAIADAGPILRKLRQMGFRREGTPTQNEREGSIEWRYTRGNYGDGDRVSIGVKLTLKKATADGAAPSCEYVKVGTKEVPDMKLLCGEELAAWREAQQVEA